MKTDAKTPASASDGRGDCVCLRLVHPTAQEVCIAGSFNDWHPDSAPMIRLNEGEWAKEVSLPPGRHEYRFVVDGQWADDPAATETAPNPFGGLNAVVEVRLRAAEADAERKRP